MSCLFVCLLFVYMLFTCSDVEDELNRIEQETTELKLKPKTDKRKQDTNKTEVNNNNDLLVLLFVYFLFID